MTETGFVPQARYMMRALDLAKQAAAMGEVPVGAVVVQKSTGRIIGEGYNRREIDRSPLAHARSWQSMPQAETWAAGGCWTVHCM